MFRFIWAILFLLFLGLILTPRAHAAPRHAVPTTRWSLFQGASPVEEARSQIGNGPVYGRRNLWCARFMNWVLEHTGHRGTGSDSAASFSRMPRTQMRVGAIAVMRHHVGIVSGISHDGNPIVISGNHGNRVREAEYSKRRVWLFVEAE